MWSQLVIDSLVRPRDAARRVLSLNVGFQVLAETALAVVCLGMVLGYLSVLLTPGAADAISATILARPLAGAAVQAAIVAIAALLVYRVGRLFGGGGDLQGALAIVVWLNMVMLGIQVLQIVALLVMPPVAQMLAIATMIWIVWAMASFVAELHGFQRLLPVIGAVILTAFLALFALAFLMSMFGLVPQGFR